MPSVGKVAYNNNKQKIATHHLLCIFDYKTLNVSLKLSCVWFWRGAWNHTWMGGYGADFLIFPYMPLNSRTSSFLRHNNHSKGFLCWSAYFMKRNKWANNCCHGQSYGLPTLLFVLNTCITHRTPLFIGTRFIDTASWLTALKMWPIIYDGQTYH